MVGNKLSGLRHYSLGIVVEDKAEGTDYAKICPIEELTLVNGLLKDATMDYEVDLPDAQGIKRKSTLNGASVVVAKWLPFSEGNRMTAPDVCERETVIIWRYADTQEFCWSTIFREPTIRRQETVCFALSNLKERLVAFDKDTSYWSEWSTKHKYVKTHTADNDGELTTYDTIIDTLNGSHTTMDGHGNYVQIDSATDTITIKAVGKIVIIGDKSVDISSTGPVSVTAGGTAVVNAKGNTTVNSESNTVVNSKESTTVSSSGRVNIVSTGAVSVQSKESVSVKSDGPATVNCKGPAEVTSLADVSVNGKSSVSVNSDGPITITGQGAVSLEGATDVFVRSDANISLESIGKTTVNSSGSTVVNAGGAIALRSPSNIALVAPVIDLVGNVRTQGQINQGAQDIGTT